MQLVISKSRLMLKVEEKIGEDIKNYLTQICKNGKSQSDIVGKLGIHRATVCRWIIKLGLERENKRPSRDELDYSYNFIRKPIRESAQEIGVYPKTYYRWLEDAGIERRQGSEAYLPYGTGRPSRDDLIMLLAKKTNTEVAALYGVDPHTLRTWKQIEGLYKFRKSKYDDLSLRIQLLSVLVENGDKEIEELNLEDFKNIKQSNGKTYRGLLNWYLSRNAYLFPIAKIEFIKDYKTKE